MTGEFIGEVVESVVVRPRVAARQGMVVLGVNAARHRLAGGLLDEMLDPVAIGDDLPVYKGISGFARLRLLPSNAYDSGVVGSGISPRRYPDESFSHE